LISFKSAQYTKSVILYAVYFYVRFPVSYRDLEEIMAENDLDLDHASLNPWVEKYAGAIAEKAQPRELPRLCGRSGCRHDDPVQPGAGSGLDAVFVFRSRWAAKGVAPIQVAQRWAHARRKLKEVFYCDGSDNAAEGLLPFGRSFRGVTAGATSQDLQ
jgi:hypothetical protein